MYLSQTPVAVDECAVSLKQGEAVLETSKSLLALVSRGDFVAPVGRFVCLVQGSNVLFTDGDLRSQLKKGDEIFIANQSFIVSPNPNDLYARDCIALDRRYEGPSLRMADTELGHVVTFERGSTECRVDCDTTEKLRQGDHYTLAGVTSSCLTTTSGRTKESVYATPTIVPDCLVSLNRARIKRGDRVVIGGEVYRVSTNHFYRFTADQVPLDSERVGDSVDMDDLQVGDRVADLKDDLQKRDLLTKTQKTTDAIGEKMRPGAEKVAASAGKLKDAAGVAYAKAFGATVLK
ncbi:hypothetical protein DYB38_003409 [Aphanomyces astaci]|uniref:Uncharacterized protein n=1 Tax=Aphanomyces astaci TaxID=112090 RepID=A0A397CYS3_APHAT|nr:hypothetical protein DYB38_003409 [Aphanomyces astaci]